MGRRGLSVLELLLTLAIAMILLGVGLMPRGGHGATSQGLAQVLAEELRAARLRALTSGKSVALVLPTQNGLFSHSQSFYILEGVSTPSVSRVVNFSGEFPRSSLFIGVWPLDPLALRNPALVNTALPPSAGLLAEGFDPAKWLPSGFRDFALIFTPSGGVASNGLANFDGDYHILVGQGVVYAPGDSPPAGAPLPQYPIAYRVPSAAGMPWTVNLSRTGSVSINQGVTGTSSVQSSARPLDSGPNPTPPRLAAGPNHPPRLVGAVESRPQAVLGTLPVGATATLASDGHLTMRVRALDPDGDALWLSWSCASGRLSGGGQELRMEPVDWSGKDRVWEGNWEWFPPPTGWSAADLTFQVSDRRGGTVSGNLGASARVAELAPGKLAWVRDYTEVCVSKADGTSVISYAPDPNPNFDSSFWSAVFSPDGSRLAVGLDRYATMGDTENTGFLVMSSDLRITHESNMTDEFDPSEFPSWNPTGTRLGAVRTGYDASGEVSASNVSEVKPNGQLAAQRVPTAPLCWVMDFSYSRKGNKYCYSIWDPARPDAHSCSIMVGTVGGSEFDLLHGTAAPTYADDVGSPSFSPDGTKIVYCDAGVLKTIASTGGTPTPLLSTGMHGLWPVWAPSGDWVAFWADDETCDHLYVTQVGGVPHLVSAGLSSNYLAWAPDATQLIFSACVDDESLYDIYRVNMDGSQLVNLTNTPEEDEDYPSWSAR